MSEVDRRSFLSTAMAGIATFTQRAGAGAQRVDIHHHFVPPLFDLDKRDTFWPAGESELAEIAARLEDIDRNAQPLRPALARRNDHLVMRILQCLLETLRQRNLPRQLTPDRKPLEKPIHLLPP